MLSNNNLYLPVSLGEAIDKLTILDIKLCKINDSRKNDVKNEYDLLYDKLKEFILKYNDLYKTMKKVNLLIWDMMDILRDDGNINENEYLKICKECIEFNDIRFRIKNKINYISESFLKEQKSYKINRLVIIINKEIIDNMNTLIDIIKYFSFIYDEIIIESAFSLSYLRDSFYYDNTILFKTQSDLLIDYKCKVVIENGKYSKDELYKLFNIIEKEINKIL
jgi:hypothetical protein